MKNFIRLFNGSKTTNGIVGQVKRAERDVVKAVSGKVCEYAATSAITGGVTAAVSSIWNGSLATALACGVGTSTYTSFFKKDALKAVKEAIKHCKTLKASEEYKAVLDRAAKIKGAKTNAA